MPNLLLLKSDKKILPTADGSFSMYNTTFKEGYHAKSVGAYSESLHKYVKASGVIEKLKRGEYVKLLDISLGVGCNLAVTFSEALKADASGHLYVITTEIDPEMPNLIKNEKKFFPRDGYDALTKALDTGRAGNMHLDILIGDAVKTLCTLQPAFDIVYFDPFSKRRTPQMWTQDVFRQLFRLLADDGIIVTYSSGRAVREDFSAVGFKWKDLEKLPDDFHKGTIFYK